MSFTDPDAAAAWNAGARAYDTFIESGADYYRVEVHGPALLLCGGQDETVPCDGIEGVFDATNEQPIMLANYLSADHANWVTFFGDEISPMEAAVTAWMRVQLMDDTALRPWFYGAECQLCTDPAWEINQKMMDE